MITITLDFPKSETWLAGFPYGESVYKNQAESHFVFGEDITIVFPPHIVSVASSFVQGFFAPIIAVLGYKGVEKKVTIVTGNPRLTESIQENIY